MSALPALPLSPLPEDRSAELVRLLEGLEPAGLWWVCGYAAALAAHPAGPGPTPPGQSTRDPAPQERLTVVYGSQTGNAKRIAEKLAHAAEGAGLAVRLLRADAYPQRELKQERLLYLVISTQGEGEPPDDARGLFEFLSGKRAPALPDLKYAVLGLGDSSYPQFCVIGRRLDARLAELGAARVAPAGEADLDIETVATPWLERALAAARDAQKAATLRGATVTTLRTAGPLPVSEWTRERPFAAEVLANQRITARNAGRDVRHLELSLNGSGLAYAPGDAVGIWPTNPVPLVEAILDTLHLDGQSAVTHSGESQSLRGWLLEKRELTRLSRPFVVAHAALARESELNRLLAADRAGELSAFLQSYQVVDVLRRFPAAWLAEGLVAALRPLTPRLYSIASSRRLVGEEVHLTVASLAYDAFGSVHTGSASAFLAAQAQSACVPVFIEGNDRFRVPKDPSRDVIMIGPGTGVAPFRAFVQERAAVGASGRNWLFFGNPHFDRDFLYQLEWQSALREHTLNRLDLAFSRDQASKIYVQQRLREQGRDVYDWLEGGAYLYVCGDAAKMAKDVHAALLDVIATHSGKDRGHATGYLDTLQQQGRYARDVY